MSILGQSRYSSQRLPTSYTPGEYSMMMFSTLQCTQATSARPGYGFPPIHERKVKMRSRPNLAGL